MRPAYVLAQVDLLDPVAFAEYKARAPAIMAPYGAEFLVRGGRYQRLEGREPLSRHVVMRFPSFERALQWYCSAEYTALKELRLRCAVGDIVLVEGL